MTSHELARKLLEKPDVPVCIQDRDGDFYAVNEIEPFDASDRLPLYLDGSWVNSVACLLLRF